MDATMRAIGSATGAFFVPRFGHDLPDVPNIPVQLKIFPPYIRSQHGLDFDTSGLLIADRVVLDTQALEFINEPGHVHLAPMRQTVRELTDKGKLQTKDFSSIQRTFESAARTWVDTQIARPERWVDVLRTRFAAQVADVEDQLAAISGTADRELELLPFGIVCALSKGGNLQSAAERSRLMRLFLSNKNRFTVGERDTLKEIVRPYVAQTAIDMLLSQRLAMPFISWDIDDGFYELLSLPDVRERVPGQLSKDELEACRHLLIRVIPELRPVSIDELIEFSKDRIARKTLVASLQQAVSSGVPISSATIANIQRELILSAIEEKKRGRLINLAIGIVGLPVAFLPVVTSLIFSVFGIAVTELTGRSQIHRWYSKLLSQASRRQSKDNAAS